MIQGLLKKEFKSGWLTTKLRWGILLIASLFCFSSGFTAIPSDGPDVGKKDLLHPVYPCSASCFSASHTDLPFLPQAVELEENETADDEDPSLESSISGLSNLSRCRDIYGYNLRSRYLQQYASILFHPRIPLFILHHSWRSFPL